MRRNKIFRGCLLVILFVAALFAVTSFKDNGKDRDKAQWKLVWVDNFNKNCLDTTVWGYMKRGRDASRKYHSSNPDCYAFRKGKLIIKGIKNPDRSSDTASYLTGGITTQDKKAFKPPFKVEIRAKIGSAKGAWPAFWMMPFVNENGWPKDGEIDIMEHLNYDRFVYHTVHSAYTKADRNAKPQRFTKSDILPDKFNTYGVEVTENYVFFSVNGKETLTYPRVDKDSLKGQFPFFRDWYLMLDMQLGGSWVGKLDPDDLPVEMEIDWVKYYRRK